MHLLVCDGLAMGYPVSSRGRFEEGAGMQGRARSYFSSLCHPLPPAAPTRVLANALRGAVPGMLGGRSTRADRRPAPRREIPLMLKQLQGEGRGVGTHAPCSERWAGSLSRALAGSATSFCRCSAMAVGFENRGRLAFCLLAGKALPRSVHPQPDGSPKAGGGGWVHPYPQGRGGESDVGG